jgi:hypothetical protein
VVLYGFQCASKADVSIESMLVKMERRFSWNNKVYSFLKIEVLETWRNDDRYVPCSRDELLVIVAFGAYLDVHAKALILFASFFQLKISCRFSYMLARDD